MAASNYLNESNSVSLLFIHICVYEYPYKGFIQQEAKRMNAFANIKIGLSKLVELFSIMNANPFLLIVLVGFTLVLCGNIGKKYFWCALFFCTLYRVFNSLQSPPRLNIAVRDIQSSQRNANVQSLLLAGSFLYN